MDIETIAYGIITGIVATAFGILWTVWQRRNERKKEDLEIIQTYSGQISEIMNEEQNLETKLQCTLYAERYLDILEQLASLYKKNTLRRDVADYFENNFSYGINIWKWYKKNGMMVKKLFHKLTSKADGVNSKFIVIDSRMTKTN